MDQRTKCRRFLYLSVCLASCLILNWPTDSWTLDSVLQCRKSRGLIHWLDTFETLGPTDKSARVIGLSYCGLLQNLHRLCRRLGTFIYECSWLSLPIKLRSNQPNAFRWLNEGFIEWDENPDRVQLAHVLVFRWYSLTMLKALIRQLDEKPCQPIRSSVRPSVRIRNC